MVLKKNDITHEEYRNKLANVADLAVNYINTGNGYFRMSDAFNELAEQCGAMMKRPSAGEKFLPSLFALSAFPD